MLKGGTTPKKRGIDFDEFLLIAQFIEFVEKIGVNYVKEHLAEACESYPSEEYDDLDYEYFLGFEDDEATGLWTVFARVSINRETEKVTFLDYKTPDGHRMDNPMKPTSFA